MFRLQRGSRVKDFQRIRSNGVLCYNVYRLSGCIERYTYSSTATTTEQCRSNTDTTQLVYSTMLTRALSVLVCGKEEDELPPSDRIGTPRIV